MKTPKTHRTLQRGVLSVSRHLWGLILCIRRGARTALGLGACLSNVNALLEVHANLELDQSPALDAVRRLVGRAELLDPAVDRRVVRRVEHLEARCDRASA